VPIVRILTLAEYQDTAPLPSLNTAIFLFREALTLRPGPALRLESLNDLATALAMRANQTNQREDREEVLSLQPLIHRNDNHLTLTGAEEQTGLDVRIMSSCLHPPFSPSH
jgi:hypothetical protein